MTFYKNFISLSTAGGGKTTKLIEHLNKLLQSISIERILILSFSNSACDEIFDRSGIEAKTMHSFLKSFLNYNISLDVELFVQMFLHNFFNLNQLGTYRVSKLVEQYYIHKNLAVPLTPLMEEFKELLSKIETEKQKHKLIFCSEIMDKFKMEASYFGINEQYDHLIVDEAQDLSESQLDILYLIIENCFAEEKKSFFIVGDVKQSIYEFNGASPAHYLLFLQKIEILCEKLSLPLIIERHHKTYRFGGQILQKVNDLNLDHHESNLQDGIYKEILLEKQMLVNYVCELIHKLLKTYQEKEIMILYERRHALIKELQSSLGRGFSMKIWLSNNNLVQSLIYIWSWCTRREFVGFLKIDGTIVEDPESSYYAAKILQSCFYYLEEPCFYFAAFFLKNIENFDLVFFQQLFETKDKFPYFLIHKIHGSLADICLFNKLYSEFNSYTNFGSFMHNLPETMEIETDGIKFSTICGAKGSESQVVIYIVLPLKELDLKLHLNPFSFEKTKVLVEVTKASTYVAYTRAKKELYVVRILNDL